MTLKQIWIIYWLLCFETQDLVNPNKKPPKGG